MKPIADEIFNTVHGKEFNKIVPIKLHVHVAIKIHNIIIDGWQVRNMVTNELTVYVKQKD